MTRLLKFSQFPEWYSEEHLSADLHHCRDLPPWTEMVVIPETTTAEVYALVGWFPPNALPDLGVLHQFSWCRGTGNWALIEVVSFLSAM